MRGTAKSVKPARGDRVDSPTALAIVRPFPGRTSTAPRMYAVVRTGGKQYRVARNDVISVETLAGETGDPVTLEDVLMIVDGQHVVVGSPTVAGASVAATVLEQTRDDKVVVFKKLRRKGYRRKRGHRQCKTVLRIGDIVSGSV